MNTKKLFLVDAMAIIFRAYYAMNKNPRINSKGLNTSAILGFANTLLDMIKENEPTHIGVAFDLSGPTIRHEQYEDYKANREDAPEDIVESLPIIRDLLDAMNIPILSAKGYEADDVIGTLAKKAAKEGFTVYMATTDKDYAQLVEENVFMYRLGRMGSGNEVLGVEEVKEKFEVRRPEQVIDILGLWGDSSDNIPGVPRIGEKRAKTLMKDFDSIEDILENTDKIKSDTIRKAIEENKDLALLSKDLATIILDVPIELDEEELEFKSPNPQKIKDIFELLEFRTFEKRFFSVFNSLAKSEMMVATQAETTQIGLFDEVNQEPGHRLSSSFNNINTVEHDYRFIDSKETREELFKEIRERGCFAFDTETTGLDFDSEIIGLSFSTQPHKGYFLFLNQSEEEKKTILEDYREVFEDESIEKVAHNLKFDKNILMNYGIEVKGNCFDTVLAHYLVKAEQRHSLEILSVSYFNYEMIPYEMITPRKTKTGIINPKTVDRELFKNYAVEDADITLRLKPMLEKELEESGLMTVFKDIEMPLVNVLMSMEREGVRIDTHQLNEFSEFLDQKIRLIEDDIYSLSGEVFNVSSPKQLGEVLFEKMKIDPSSKRRGPSKQYSTAEDVLLKIRDRHEIVDKVLEYRSLTKLKSTYVDSFPKLVNPKTNRLHTSYSQSTAVTGRLSSRNPNLQNIPIRTELGKEIRKAFVPRNEDYKLMAADYSQIELRIIASLSQDANMLEAFEKGLDIHQSTASKIYKIGLDEVSPEMRNNAKGVNFGIIYGISAFGLSEQLEIQRKEAQDLIDEYFNTYPDIKNYIDSSISLARDRGYAETMTGRRRYLPDIKSANGNIRSFAERNAVNMPIQGSSADMIKIAMIAIQKELEERGLSSKMILQVHDELVFDVYMPEIEEVKEIVEREMKASLSLNLPIIVDIKTGDNWLEAH